MGIKLFRVDMINAMGSSMAAIVVPPAPVVISNSAILSTSFKLNLQRTNTLAINFSEISVNPSSSYSVTIPAGFITDTFGVPNLEQVISFTTPALPSIVSFTPASNDPMHNTYGEDYVYINYNRPIHLENKNYYLYSDYNNPSGTLIATFPAYSNKVSIVSDTKIRIDISANVIPLRRYWITSDSGIVKDKWGLASPIISSSTYDFRAFKNSKAYIQTISTASSKVIKSPTFMANNSNIAYSSVYSKIYKNRYTERSFNNNGSNNTITAKVYDMDSGTVIRTKSVSYTSYNDSYADHSVSSNSTHIAISIATYPMVAPPNSFIDHSVVYIYSLATGSLTATINSNGHIGFGVDIELTDSKLFIRAPFEHDSFTAGIYIYDFNPITGGVTTSTKINRPIIPWNTVYTGLKTTQFGAEGMQINDNYIALRSPGSSSSDLVPYYRIYTLNGTYQRTITSAVSTNTSFYAKSINSLNLMPIDTLTNEVKIYDISSGTLTHTIPAANIQGINDEFAIIGNRLYELSSNTYFTNTNYVTASQTHLLGGASNTSFYKF